MAVSTPVTANDCVTQNSDDVRAGDEVTSTMMFAMFTSATTHKRKTEVRLIEKREAVDGEDGAGEAEERRGKRINEERSR